MLRERRSDGGCADACGARKLPFEHGRIERTPVDHELCASLVQRRQISLSLVDLSLHTCEPVDHFVS